MSHFTTVGVEIKDIEALNIALKEMGLNLTKNDQCRYYYGTETMPQVIRLPGSYDCGVVKSGESYFLKYDKYEGEVERYLGKDGIVLLQNYTRAKVELEAKRMRYKCVRKGDIIVIYNPKNSAEKLEVTFNEDGSAVMRAKGFKGSGCMVFDSLEKALGTVTDFKVTSDYGAKVKVSDQQQLKAKL